MGSNCGSRLVLEEPLLPVTQPSPLLDKTVCVVAAFSFPFVFLLLDAGTDVGSDVDWSGGGGRAYSSVQRFAVRSCCARLRVYSVAIEGTGQHA